MAGTMVRTQVYLPRDVYEKLRQRAEKHKLTLALQIRAALEDYLGRVEAEEDDGILHADDPIFKMIGLFDSGLGDLSVNHDHYLYGAPRREPLETIQTARINEKPATTYGVKKPKKSMPKRKAK